MRAARQFTFNDDSIVLQAALKGQGIALGWHHVVAPLVAQGRLVRAVTEDVTADNPIYRVATHSGHLPSAAVSEGLVVGESAVKG